MTAQDDAGTFDRALAELRRGRKTSHWMWFIFPQIAGLGITAVAQRYAISSLAEARAYLAHPVLGPRLLTVAGVVVGLTDDADDIFGSLDAMKLRSSATLFHRASPTEQVFADVLARFFDGVPDPNTDRRLAG